MGLTPTRTGKSGRGGVGLAPSWSESEGVVLTPPGAGGEAWSWPLLERERKRGSLSPLQERERKRGLSPLVEWEKRLRLSLLLELEKRRGLGLFWSGR